MLSKLCAVSALTLSTLTVCAFQPAVQRPRITGVANVGFFTSDLPKALVFWHDFLGYDEAYGLPKKDSLDTRITVIKINDHQHVELINEPPIIPRNMLSHVCFAVDDIAQMRAFLRLKGVDIKENPSKTRTGDYAFEIQDPDGTRIEFVQTLPSGVEAKAVGKHLTDTRVASSIYHVGFTVADSRTSLAFYSMLGFAETWRGSPNTTELAWINLKVPDGTDYIELMLFHGVSDPNTWGGKNHISLVVPDIEKAVATLATRATAGNYTRSLKINTGINRKRQVNLFDPDGTRVELMEPNTIDGKVTPSSTAPPPIP